MNTDNTQGGAEPSPASAGYRGGIATREADLVGRLPLAAVLRCIAPGYSACKRCKMPWAFTQGHCTKWNKNGGMFPLCEHCWERLSPSERLPYYKMLWQEWHEWGPVRDPAWHDVEAAVMAGL
jgi:hypothetical protein